jgi:hypothetical protein
MYSDSDSSFVILLFIVFLIIYVIFVIYSLAINDINGFVICFFVVIGITSLSFLCFEVNQLNHPKYRQIT